MTHSFSPLMLLFKLIMRTAQGADSTTCSAPTPITHQSLIWKLNMTVSLPTIYHALPNLPSYYLLQRPPHRSKLNHLFLVERCHTIFITIMHKLVCFYLLLIYLITCYADGKVDKEAMGLSRDQQFQSICNPPS